MTRQFLKISTASLKAITDVYEQQIYIYLKKNTNIAGFCSQSYTRMANALNISRAKIISSISALIEKGLIKRERIITANGGCGINQYYLCDIPEFWQLHSNQQRKEMLEEYSKKCTTYNSSTSGCSVFASEYHPENISFVKVFYELIESAKLTIREKALYIALKRYKNNKTGLCFPALATLAAATGCCIKTVAKYINKLVDKGIIQKDTYYNSSGGKMASCRYTLHDDAKLFVAKDKEAALSKSLKQPKKKQEVFNTLGQASYPCRTIEDIREYYRYDELLILAEEQQIDSKYIDIALELIKHELNTSSENFIYKGETMPHKILQAEYEKLTSYNIIEAVSKYLEQYNKIYNHEAYLKILLYTIRQQSMLETVNTVNNILYDV